MEILKKKKKKKCRIWCRHVCMQNWELAYTKIEEKTKIKFLHNSKMNAKMITKSEKGVSASTFEHATKTLLDKVAATSENDFQKASHKSCRIVENSNPDTTLVPDTHFYVRAGVPRKPPASKNP